MSDLISRQAAIDIVSGYAEKFNGYIGSPNDSEVYAYARGLLLGIERNINAVPSAQPERKHGEWIKGQFMDSGLKCPFCGFVPYDPSGCDTFNYCPNCGAKMDGGKDDE